MRMRVGRAFLAGLYWMLFWALTVHASEIRVNTLGPSGLVPDEEVDISLNPASLGFIKNKRIFGGIYYNRNTGGSSSGVLQSYIEYVHPFSLITTSVKYYPAYSTYKADNGHYRYSEKEQNIDFKIGWQINNSLVAGIALKSEDYQSKIENDYVWISLSPTQEDITTHAGTLGITYIISDINKMSMVLIFDESKKLENSDYSRRGDNKDYGRGIRFLSETLISDKSTLRTNLLLKYQWDKGYHFTYVNIDKDLNGNNSSLIGVAGIGLSHLSDPGTLWILSLNDNFTIYDKQYEEGKYAYIYQGVNYEDSEVTQDSQIKEHDFDVRLGLEKDIFKSLLLRGNVYLFNYRYNRRDVGDAVIDDESSKDVTILGPIYSYDFGIGYRVLNNLLFDFNLSNRMYFRNNYSKNYQIEFATTYLF